MFYHNMFYLEHIMESKEKELLITPSGALGRSVATPKDGLTKKELFIIITMLWSR